MSVNPQNFLMGPATAYIGAIGVITAPPADSAVNSAPAASAWTDLGGTVGGVTPSVDPKFTPLDCDQIVDLVDSRLTSRTIQVAFAMAEATLANLAMALNTTVGMTGAGYATLEPNYSTNASQTQKYSLLVDGLAPIPTGGTAASYRRRMYFPRVQQEGKISPPYKKDGQWLLDVMFQCYYVSNTVAPFHWTDQTS